MRMWFTAIIGINENENDYNGYPDPRRRWRRRLLSERNQIRTNIALCLHSLHTIFFPSPSLPKKQKMTFISTKTPFQFDAVRFVKWTRNASFDKWFYEKKKKTKISKITECNVWIESSLIDDDPSKWRQRRHFPCAGWIYLNWIQTQARPHNMVNLLFSSSRQTYILSNDRLGKSQANRPSSQPQPKPIHVIRTLARSIQIPISFHSIDEIM